MEKGNPPDNWIANGAKLSAGAGGHSGKQSIRIAPLVDYGRATQNIPVKPNTKYRLDFWYKCGEGGGIYFYVNADKVIFADKKSDEIWTHWSGEFDTSAASTPATTVSVGFCGWPGGDLLIDDVSVTELKANDAATPAAKPAAAAEKPGAELVINGDMEKGNPPENWNANGAKLKADADSHSGKQSIRISPAVDLGRAAQSLPVKPNTKYRLDFWYKCSEVGGVYFYVHADKTIFADKKSDAVWTRWTGEFDTSAASAPATTVSIAFCGWPGGDLLIDDVSVVEAKPNEAAIPAVKETPAEPSPAAKPQAADPAGEKVAQSWRLLFPGREYVCWEQSPWDKVARFQLPPSAEKPGYEFPFQECKEINVSMGGNEYESASFVLTNLSSKTLEFLVSAKDSGVPVTIREAVWVTTLSGKEVNDALPLLEGKLSIPSGESREVWLTLFSRGVKPGNYTTEIVAQAPGLPSSSVKLRTKIYPVSLPDDKPVYIQYWDYLVPEWTTPEMAQAMITDLKAHYVNTPTLHPWMARLQLDAQGKLKVDYAALDVLLGYYAQLNPKMLVFSWHPDAYLAKFDAYPFFSPEWKALFKSYINSLVSHLKEKGFGYDRFALHPYDEILDAKVCNMAKLIKEIDPNILIIANAVGTPDEMKNIAPYVDIFMPHLYGFLSQTDETKQLAKTMAKARKYYWTYANPVPPFPQAVSPYSIYRLAVWQTWQEDMGGFGNWIYNYKTHWNSYRNEDGENWAMVYLANAQDAPAGISRKELIITSKRWEATREGVEDYVYLSMLKDAVNMPAGKLSPELLNEAKRVLAESPKAVLGDMRNTTLADKAKEDMLKVLSKISAAKN